jgi:hypothetical protein
MGMNGMPLVKIVEEFSNGNPDKYGKLNVNFIKEIVAYGSD